MSPEKHKCTDLAAYTYYINNNVSSITNTRKNNRKAKCKKQNTKGGAVTGGHMPVGVEWEVKLCSLLTSIKMELSCKMIIINSSTEAADFYLCLSACRH